MPLAYRFPSLGPHFTFDHQQNWIEGTDSFHGQSTDGDSEGEGQNDLKGKKKLSKIT